MPWCSIPRKNKHVDANQQELPQDEAMHAMRVLRLKGGDELYLMDGAGCFYRAQVTIAATRNCYYEILETLPQAPQWQGHLHLAIAPTKMLDRIEWMLEKATEVGVDGMCVSVSDVEALTTELRKRGGMTLRTNFDPFDRIWKDWKKLMMEPRKIDMRFASPELIRGRMEKVRRILRQRYHADGMLMTRMEDIAWVLGLDDERNCFTKLPVSYLLIAHDKSTLFVYATGLSADALSCLLEAGISVDEYDRVGKGLQDYFEYNILVDPDQMPFGLMKYIKRIVVRGTVDL